MIYLACVVLLAAAHPAAPESAAGTSSLAEAYRAAKKYSAAIREYERIVAASPGDTFARARLAELYAWVGENEKAMVAYRLGLERTPRDPALEVGLARVLRWSRRYAESEQLYREVLELDPDHVDALKGLTRTLSLEGDLAGALRVVDRALARHPDDAELHEQRAVVLGWTRRYDEALRSVETAARLSPNHAGVWRTMGDVYSWMRRHADALRAYQRATAIEPDAAQSHVAEAQAYVALGKRPLATEQIEIALRLSPFDAEARRIEAQLDAGNHLLTARTYAGVLELASCVLVAAVMLATARRRRRVLAQRHRVYRYFARYVVPALSAIAVAGHATGVAGRWLDPEVARSAFETVLLGGLGASFLVLLHADRTPKAARHEVVLAIGAHPDDIELGCGGFLMKAKAAGARVYGLTLTTGERGAPSGASRVEELARAARYMRLDGYWVLDFPDTQLGDWILRMKEAIEARIVEVGATTVLTHTDVDVHGDHRAVFHATREAARDVPTVLAYEDVSTPNEFVPNYYVDITDYVEDELTLVGFHRTQAHREYMDPEVIKGRAAHRGLQSGVSYAEAFRAYRIIE